MKRICSITLALLVMLTCTNRQNPIHPRNNPWDSESDNFSNNSLPAISSSHDSLWYDYDHAKGSGSIKLSYTTFDANLPNDTLTSLIFVIDTTGIIREVTAESESTCIVDGLIHATTYRCSLFVSDAWDSIGTFLDTITTPVLIPPLPPSPSITSGTSSITISWKVVEGATEYSIYVAENPDGPFEFLSPVPQQPSGICSIMYPFNEPVSLYYIVASKNQSGECRSRDTLHGTIFSDEVAIPLIDSVSKGTYSDYIQIIWHANSNAVSRYELYRSVSDTSTFRVFAAIDALSGENSFNDSVTTSDYYYYKIAAIDSQGYSSRLSATDYGFLTPTTASTRLTVISNANYIELYWDPVAGASSYAVYRSSTSCSSKKDKIATTTSLSYNDSVTSIATFYYSVTAIDNTGHEVGISNCAASSRARCNPMLVCTM